MFKVGDVVQLKSGGPAMTVIDTKEEAAVECLWFGDVSETFRREILPVIALETVEFESGEGGGSESEEDEEDNED